MSRQATNTEQAGAATIALRGDILHVAGRLQRDAVPALWAVLPPAPIAQPHTGAHGAQFAQPHLTHGFVETALARRATDDQGPHQNASIPARTFDRKAARWVWVALFMSCSA